jgi:hypothetical protein
MPPLAELERSFTLSSYRENLLEQIFCAELLQGCWLADLPPVEISRPFVDFQGYDLVATCGPVTRHIQLKATRGRIAVHEAMAKKLSACVINLVVVGSTDPRIHLRYQYYGGAPGEPMSIEGFARARKAVNTRDEAGAFRKAEREHHVVIPGGRFKGPMDIVELAHALFGYQQPAAEELLEMPGTPVGRR